MLEHLETGSLWAVFVISFIEAVPLLNAYFPGAAVILIAMGSTGGDLTRAFSTFIAIVAGSTIAHQADYWAGKLFAGRVSGEKRRDGAAPTLREAFASYWHPHSGSLYSLRSGADGVPYRVFVFRFATSFGAWNIFWGVLMYHVGHLPVSGSELMMLFYIYLSYWLYQEFRAVSRVGAAKDH
jgi:hypothetical protein